MNDANDAVDKTGPIDAASKTRRMPLSRSIPISLGLMAIGLLAILGMVYALQNRIIYPRTHAVANAGPWKMVDLRDGAKGWWIPPQPGSRTIIFFHGNATDLGGVAQATKTYRQMGYGVLAPEYPGYSGTAGNPDQESITHVADLGMDWLARNGVAADDTVVYGNSIGAGPAIRAAQRPHMALVIVSGVASLEDVARNHYGMIGGLVRDKWRNDDAIMAIKGHKIIVHGMADDIVPYEQGQRLAIKAGVPLISLPGGHELAFDEGLQKQLALSLDRRAKLATIQEMVRRAKEAR